MVTFVLPYPMVSIRVVEYVREDGSIPFKEWFDSLDPAAAAKVAAAQARLNKARKMNVRNAPSGQQCPRKKE